MVTTKLVQKTLERLKFTDLKKLAQENGLQVHSNIKKNEIIQDLLWVRPISHKFYGGARTESPPVEASYSVEWDKIPEPALLGIIKQLSRNDFNRFRRTSKKFNDRIKQLETRDFYKELISSLPYVFNPIIIDTSSEVYSVAWSRSSNENETRLASGEVDGKIQIWKFNPETVTQNKPPQPESLISPELNQYFRGVRSVTWSPDGSRLASSGEDKKIRIWKFKPETGSQDGEPLTLEGHTMWVHCVAWSKSPNGNGTRLASGGSDRYIRIWKFNPDGTQDGESLKLMSHQVMGTFSVAWSPDGTRLASGGENGIRIWEFNPKNVDQVVQSYSLTGIYSDNIVMRSVAWSPDGTKLAVGGDDTKIRIWRFNLGTEDRNPIILESSIHSDTVRSVAWSPDGTRLASGGDDTRIRIWKFKPNGTQDGLPLILVGHTDWIFSVAWSTPAGAKPAKQWSPDNTRLASAGRDRKVMIWTS